MAVLGCDRRLFFLFAGLKKGADSSSRLLGAQAQALVASDLLGSGNSAFGVAGQLGQRPNPCGLQLRTGPGPAL